MPSMRHRTVALAIVAALGLAACGGSDAVEEAADPEPVAPEPEVTEAEGTEDPKEVDDYWSGDRLAALEAAKKDYVPPTPAPPIEPTADQAADTAAGAGDPVTVAAGATSGQAGSYRIEGHVDVPDHVWLREYSDGEPKDGDACRREQKGYEDVAPGSPLTVTDGAGGTLAVGKLKDGALTTSYEDKVGRAMDCRLPFTVEDVSAADSYEISLQDRGELAFSFDDLQRQGWKVAFSIDW